jgi:ABC-2 type transport system ATP-binding protein
MAVAIELTKLTKRYHRAKTDSLHEVSLHVASGEVYGFLGANGAGKTTTIRTLMGFIYPTAGSATILGKDVVRDAVEIKRHVGYLAGEAAFYPKMTGRQFLNYLRALYPTDNKQFVDHLITVFQAELGKPIHDLSKGNRQKLGLIQAFMHAPQVLILDEPTSGLDPLMQEVFFEEIKTVARNGAAVFVSSHNLAEVQRMCDRVGFIRGGELVAEQTIAELTTAAAHTFDVTFAGRAPFTELKAIKDAEVVALSDDRATVKLHGELAPLFAVLAHSKVVRFDKPGVDLEEEFLKFYGDQPKATGEDR